MDHAPEQTAGLPNLGDLCRKAIFPGQAAYGQVRDSSYDDPVDPAQDGNRLVIACSAEHLGELQQHYRQRPFNREELWTRKIDRAMRQHPEGLGLEQLEKESGLNALQIEAATTWQLQSDRARGGGSADSQ
ncbi:hypothetical protein ACFCXF_03120 [Streptomyces virginiae]|uniref:hypothetical protein n=1 Tax=Streptomyces virginiae TaxID=1961 RepID=UPI0035DEDBC0